MRLLFVVLFSLGLLNANEAQSNNQTILDSAQKHVESKNYHKAVELYEGLVQEGYSSNDLYFNLAAAYFENNQLPHAVLYYEKILKRKPYHKEALNNLRIANDLRASDISPIPDFFLLQWWRNFSGVLSSLIWSLLGMLTILVSIYFLWTYLFKNTRHRILTVSILALCFGILFLLAARTKFKLSAKETHMVNLTTINLMQGPDESSSGEIEIQPGEKLKILDRVGEWVKVSLINKDEGWIKESNARGI